MSSYQPNIPTGFVDLDLDYQSLQGNFQQLDTTFGIDHTLFSNNTAQNGYHTNIHMIPHSTTVTNPPNNQPVAAPSAVAGYGQLFDATINDGINTDQALYFLTGGNRLTQLTSNFQPVSSNNGYTYLPGGLILQWGFVTSTASTYQTLNFSTNNINFPNNCFIIFTQPYGSGTVPGSQATVEIRKSTISKTLFEWVFVTNSGEYTGFFWVAIGN